MLHILNLNFQEKIKITGDIITFHNFIDGKNIVDKLISDIFIVLF